MLLQSLPDVLGLTCPDEMSISSYRAPYTRLVPIGSRKSSSWEGASEPVTNLHNHNHRSV